MIEAVICEPLRTPVGRYGGVFKDVPAATLAENVIRALVQRTGMSGGTIRLIQQKLNTLGEKIGTDGKFGSRTAAAVQRFQRRNGLNADGAVGKATWEKLFPAS